MNFKNVDKLVFFDFETSGLRSKGTEQYPTQLCFIVTDIHGNVKQTYNKLIRGAKTLSEWVQQNCPHVTLEKLQREGVSIAEAWKNLLKHVSVNTVFIAHNAEFDWGIVNEYAADLLTAEGVKRLQYQRVFCTKEHSTKRCKIPKTGKARFYPGYKWPTLEELSNHLNVKITGPLHDALTDVIVLKDCFIAGQKKPFEWW